MGIYEKTFAKCAARRLWSKVVRKADATHHQIRQHADGTYQVIRGRYDSCTTPVATARTLEAAIHRARRRA